MLQVKHLLEGKGSAIVATTSDAPVIDAIRAMAEHHVGALLVMRGDTLEGIVSERDYARKVVLKGRSSSDTPVREIMTSQVVTVSPDDTIDHCMRVCTDKRIRHLPVVAGTRVVGVLSIGDLVAAVISEQSERIEQLQRYIAG